MNTISVLRQSAPGIASLLEDAGESGLRKVAAVVARTVVSHTGLSHPTIDRALGELETTPIPSVGLQAEVQTVADKLDEEYLALKEPLEESENAGKTDPGVSRAFSRARAASAVLAALGDDAREAAASAAYEAFTATEDSDYLTDAIRRALAI